MEIDDLWNPTNLSLGERSHREALAACWRIASEIVRRNPTRLAATHGFFNDIYDVVHLVDVDNHSHVAYLNANGTGADVGMRWPLVLSEDLDPRDWYREFERRCGLNSPSGKLPPSTPHALSARWVATFLSLNVASRTAWSTTTEFKYSYSTDESPRSAQLPGVDTWARANPQRQELLIHLVRAGEDASALVLSPDGDLWQASGEHTQLQDHHKTGSPITALVLATVPELLP